MSWIERENGQRAYGPGSQPDVDVLPTREETLKTWPEAVWFVGDPAPVGQRVLVRPDANGHRVLGEVTGRRDPLPTRPAEHCPSCTCKEDNSALSGWFLVRDLSRDAIGDAGDRLTLVPVGTTGAKPYITIEYPPSLTPAPSEGSP